MDWQPQTPSGLLIVPATRVTCTVRTSATYQIHFCVDSLIAAAAAAAVFRLAWHGSM